MGPILKWTCVFFCVFSVFGIFLPLILREIIHALGFGVHGITPGSIAAHIEEEYDGKVPKHSFFSWCQGIGQKGFDAALHTGISLGTTAMGTIIGALLGKFRKPPPTPSNSTTFHQPFDNVNLQIDNDDDLYENPENSPQQQHQDDLAEKEDNQINSVKELSSLVPFSTPVQSEDEELLIDI